MNLLIKNVYIITMNEKVGDIENGYIIVEGNKISEIGRESYLGRTEDYQIIDGKGFCAMPGLINCHTHTAMTLLRGYGEGLPLMRWLNEKIWPKEATFKEKHIELGSKLACIEMLRSGTTTFNDMYFMQREVLKSASECSVRAVLGLPLIGDGWESQLNDAIKLMNYVKREYKNNSMVSTKLAPHSAYTLSFGALKTIAAAASENNQDIHIHISETKDENKMIKEKYDMTPCELLLKAGIFDNNVVAAHCVHLSDSDINIIKDKNANPVYNSESNMKLASGVARITEMLEKGINVCIGTDGTSSNNNLNMFEELGTGAMLQNLWYEDTTRINSYDFLKMVTVNGAKALNIDNLGMLKEGCLADIILININKANMQPVYNIYSNLVFSANGSEVETVIVNGKIVMYKGEFLNIDEEKVLFECKNICK